MAPIFIVASLAFQRPQLPYPPRRPGAGLSEARREAPAEEAGADGPAGAGAGVADAGGGTMPPKSKKLETTAIGLTCITSPTLYYAAPYVSFGAVFVFTV